MKYKRPGKGSYTIQNCRTRKYTRKSEAFASAWPQWSALPMSIDHKYFTSPTKCVVFDWLSGIEIIAESATRTANLDTRHPYFTGRKELWRAMGPPMIMRSQLAGEHGPYFRPLNEFRHMKSRRPNLIVLSWLHRHQATTSRARPRPTAADSTCREVLQRRMRWRL